MFLIHKLSVRHLLWPFVVWSGLILSACGTTGLMEMPKVELMDAPAVTMPLHRQATFLLDKVVANIKRGTIILHFPSEGLQTNVDGTLCNFRNYDDTTREWRGGSSSFGSWTSELGEVFHEVLSAKGFNIKGDPKKMFGRENISGSAEYLIGARIKEIRGNICHAHHWWDGRALRMYSGEIYIEVEWRIFSILLNREVLVVGTKAYHLQKTLKKNSILLMLNNAFANAAEALLADKKFAAIALRKDKNADKTYVFKGTALELPRRPTRIKKLDGRINSTLSAIVTVRVSGGHGSGFAISEDGYILTNAHVVGDTTRIPIKLSNGLEVEGRVLSVNEHRDVALIKAPIRIPWALPIRKTLAKRLEKVFVVGSPIDAALQSTVTTGIISAIRERESGLIFIQSDVAISPGNSGGPMLDEYGNVIGISVSGVVADRAQNLNFFIPINDALRALKISLTEKPGGR